MRKPITLPRLLLILPAVHLLLFTVTILAQGEWIRIIVVDPFVVPFLFSNGSTAVLVFAVLGTLSWLGIGYIGWRSANGSVGRMFGAPIGVFLLLYSLLGILFFLLMLVTDIKERRFEFVLVVQEVLIAVLWAGSVTSSIYCFGAASQNSDPF